VLSRPSAVAHTIASVAGHGWRRVRSLWDPRARLIRRVAATKRARQADGPYRDVPGASLILLSFNHRANVDRLVSRLRRTAADELIVCDDGSIDGSERRWLRHLTRPNDFLIRSNDLHEIRTYNRAVGLARGRLVCLLQDDDIPPEDGAWVGQALALFDRHSELGVLGVFQGWSLDFQSDVLRPRQVFGARRSGTKDAAATIPFRDPAVGIPFMFVEGVNLGPVWFRRDVFVTLGGFDLAFSGPGEPGILLDHDICLRAWLGGWTVALYGSAAFERNVGGQGTLMFGRAARDRNVKRNFERLRETYGPRMPAIDAMVADANRRLVEGARADLDGGPVS
jgi:glycosyltransferase involved in cell wall biosynthesis